MKITEALFVVIGVALLGGSVAWYYYGVQRPLTWPRADAVVVSSRVINPLDPGQYKPELVLQLESEGRTREVTVTPFWSSGSYAMVKSHVDRYPTGSRVEVAVNPADQADVRYALGPTAANLIGPGALAFMGLLFAGIGIGLWRRARRQAGPTTDPALSVGTVAAIFGVIGVVIIVIGLWLLSRDLEMLRSWEAVDAESIAVRTVSSRSSVGNRPSTLMYDVQVTFRYEVNGSRIESQTTSGLASSSTRRRDALLQQFAAGTRHRIRHRPDDPNVIRYGLDYSFRTFLLSGGMTMMGLVFLGFAAMIRRRYLSLRPA